MFAFVALFNGCRDYNYTGFPLHLLVAASYATVFNEQSKRKITYLVLFDLVFNQNESFHVNGSIAILLGLTLLKACLTYLC